MEEVWESKTRESAVKGGEPDLPEWATLPNVLLLLYLQDLLFKGLSRIR